MIVAKENIYYQNRMFKPKEQLPCHDIKMVQAWLKSGVAIDTTKGVVKTTPIGSKNKQNENAKETVEEKTDNTKDEKPEEKICKKSNTSKITTRSSNKK